MIPAWDKTGISQPMYFVCGEIVTETEFRKYLRSQGMTHREIENYFKAARHFMENVD
jgi:hypothetical protein